MFALLLFPPSVIVVYSIYVLVKPQSETDEFFFLHKDLSQQALIRRVEILEHFHHKDFSKEKEKISRYFLDSKLSEKELEYLEDIITRTYFDGFIKRWSVFRRADSVEKLVFLTLILSGIITVAIGAAYGMNKNPDFTDVLIGIIPAIILVPVTLISILMILGILSFMLSILRFTFPRKGSLLKATIFSEEFIKALKPGGRSTEIVLPKSRIFPGGMMP